MKQLASSFWALALATTATTLTACSTRNTPEPSAPITGAWTQTAETLTTEPRNGGAKTTTANSITQPVTFTFLADGTVSFVTAGSGSAPQVGTYIYTPSVLDLSLDIAGVRTPVTVSKISATDMEWVILSRDAQNTYALIQSFKR